MGYLLVAAIRALHQPAIVRRRSPSRLRDAWRACSRPAHLADNANGSDGPSHQPAFLVAADGARLDYGIAQTMIGARRERKRAKPDLPAPSTRTMRRRTIRTGRPFNDTIPF